MKCISKLMAMLLIVFMTLPIFADDGMWMPHQMKEIDLRKQGLEMDPADLFKDDGTGLMSAVVSLGGGTGEFVSSRGLILTNHHVAFGALQRASDKDHDYISNGFIAGNKEAEIPAYGYIADVLLDYQDVTARVQKALKDGMTPKERFAALDRIKKDLVKKAEKTGRDIRARVAAMYGGNQYYLFRFKHLKDIRIVYAPPRDLGNFGGDIDNWMWPRHTADFSFLRAYVSPKGDGVEYSKENVPYQPKSVLKISLDGVKDGDFTFVMGYPGRTYRNQTLAEFRFDAQDMQDRLIRYRDLIRFFDNAGKKDKAVEIKYASLVKGLNNVQKNYQGKLDGFRKANIFQKKEKMEDKFQKWVQSDPERKAGYGNTLSDINDFMNEYAANYRRDQAAFNLIHRYAGPALLIQAYTIYRNAVEHRKPDMKRDPDYQNRNADVIKRRVRLAEQRYDLATDQAYFKHLLEMMFTLPKDEVPAALQSVVATQSADSVNAFVDNLYDHTVMANPNERLKLLEMNPKQLKTLNDPLINLAEHLEIQLKASRDREDAMDQHRLDLRTAYLEAMLKYKKGRLAPDANSTIRFTYGNVAGYSPRDAVWYKPQTTLSGVVEKDTGEFPFHVPDKIKSLEQDKDFGPYADKGLNDVATCFLNTTNVTGGNSGSPTLNAKGEQVGIIFDMTYESVTGDYFVVPELQRTISVDIRYVLFITDKFSGVHYLLEEMGL